MEPETSQTTEQLGMETSSIPVLQQLGILVVILLLIFGSTLIPEFSNDAPQVAEQATPTVATVSEAIPTELTKNSIPFENISISGNAAFVWDVRSQKVLYQENPDEQLPLASITKLMTALVAHELITDNERVIIDELSIKQSGSSGFLTGEVFSLKNLLGLTLMSSSNDGAYAIASAAGAVLDPNDGANPFVKAMNIRAEEIGLTQTYFRNPTGLDITEEEGGAYGSARDVTFLMEYILSNYPEILEQTQEDFTYVTNEAGASHSVENTNPTLKQVDGLIGSKTGYTDLAGGNLTIAFDAALNRPVIVVVLGSTRTSRFADVLSLAEQARLAVNQ